MRLFVSVLLLSCAACSRGGSGHPDAADAAADREAAAATGTVAMAPAPAQVHTPPPPPPPAVSPVQPFRGGGQDWTVQLHSARGLRHDVSLQWEGQMTPGQVEFRLPAAGPKPDAYRLDGVLYTPQGDVGLSILIGNGACSDGSEPGGGHHDHTVQVSIQGRAQLRGCGDLAAY